MRRITSPLAALSPSYLDFLYQLYSADRTSVDVGWRVLFDTIREADSAAQPRLLEGGPAIPDTAMLRWWGHQFADLDPLEAATKLTSGDLLKELQQIAQGSWSDSRLPSDGMVRRYCTSLAIELGHIDDARVREMIVSTFEMVSEPTFQQRVKVLEQLRKAETFEKFLGTKFPTKKRFGIEGGETLLPMLERVLERAAERGVTEVVIGTMHRGRLNIMGNILGEPMQELLRKFKGAHPFDGASDFPADVPYHLGYTSSREFAGGKLKLTLLPNPSHLEAVNPVVLGRVRARQDRLAAESAAPAKSVLGVLLHTDASVIGQGGVAETIQLAGLKGYSTAGTVHIVVNNQIGFTTEPEEGRSSKYCTGAWKAIDCALLHVNANDPDAAYRAATIAVDVRQDVGCDSVIDLVCYRRNGHNEIDEPRFTQPRQYAVIDELRPISAIYADRLAAEGIILEKDDPEFRWAELQQAYAAAMEQSPLVDGGQNQTSRITTGTKAQPEMRQWSDRDLSLVLERLSDVPGHLAVNSKVERIVRQRKNVEQGIAWATAEMLAFATLMMEGVSVRFSGQDILRGAFSQRHYVLTDAVTGNRHISLQHIAAGQAPFHGYNSPLSEYAVLGFEYGYSVDRPDALTFWEAQFGDFANGAQIIIDQFITSGHEKWLQDSNIVVSLPHGLEGQGPEHSSARIERLLQMAANNNIHICNPSTPANYFLLLRRHGFAFERKPLFITTPKTLLRLPAAVSPVDEFVSDKEFRPILATGVNAAAKRICLCSGKIAYELMAEIVAQGLSDVGIVRLEQLYPFPGAELAECLKLAQQAECCWVQEEPINMGPWTYVDQQFRKSALRQIIKGGELEIVARAESASPAGSFHGRHEQDQRDLVKHALARTNR